MCLYEYAGSFPIASLQHTVYIPSGQGDDPTLQTFKSDCYGNNISPVEHSQLRTYPKEFIWPPSLNQSKPV